MYAVIGNWQYYGVGGKICFWETGSTEISTEVEAKAALKGRMAPVAN